MADAVRATILHLKEAGFPTYARAIESLQQKCDELEEALQHPSYAEENKLRSQLAAERARADRLQAVVDAAKAQVSQAEAYCVGRARFSRTGGNVGISWYVEDAMGETNGHRTGNPKDGDLLFVLAAQKPAGGAE